VNERAFGRSGLRVGEVGLGAWGLGDDSWSGQDDAGGLAALERALELGVTFFDTALVYGDGHSERLVGRAAGRRDDVLVATKIPALNGAPPTRERPVRIEQAYPAWHVIACTEESLRNLGREAIDLQQLHVWSAGWLGAGDWLEALQELREAGKVRHVGVSLNDHDPASALELVASGAVDSVQAIFNVFDQSPRDELLDACARHGVAFVARVPFDEGALTGAIRANTRFPPGDFRAHYFRDERPAEVERRVEALLRDAGIARDELPELALRFVLAHPAVSVVIPGMRSVTHVARNVRAGDGAGLPPAMLERLLAHRWERNWYR
jgi:aryl-alcohol dehydrogenase-like predicted oxidoreductase